MNRASATELRLPIGNLTIAAKTWGDPAHPPMLALHGWLDNAGTFDRLAPLLRHRYIVAIDLAGHGRSDHRGAGNWYAYVDFLDEIAAVIAHFGWTRVDLLGHSLGATLVSAYAAIAPQEVGRLLLVEGLGPLTTPSEKTLDVLQRAVVARAAFTGQGLRVFSSIDAAVEARCRAGSLSADAARCIVERGLKESDASANAGEPGYVWSSDPRLMLPSAQRFTEQQLSAVLDGIRAPTLLILAEPEAPYLARAMIEARIARVDDIDVVRMRGNHHLHLEDAAAVSAPMLAFLKP